jgi:DNA end-binding protein Ku
VLELMHFEDELADPAQLGLPNIESGAKELDMALSLVKAMSEKWKPDTYRDEYADALMKVIEKKIGYGGKELPPASGRGVPRATNVVDIVAMLQESINRHSKKPVAEPKKARKRV